MVHWSIDLGDPSARVVRSPVSDLVGEFPRFDERFAGLPYRHCWQAANVDLREALLFDSIAHLDLKSGKQTVRTFPSGDSVGEPIFAPRSAQAPEGDGWILAIVHRAAEGRSDLLILNAQDIDGEPEAVLELPVRVPAGFHGSWVSG